MITKHAQDHISEVQPTSDYINDLNFKFVRLAFNYFKVRGKCGS